MKILKTLLTVIIVISIIFISQKSAHSENFNSDNYKIQFGNINIGGEDLESDSYDLSTSIGQSFAEKFQSDGYIVRAGFQYIHSIIPFSFAISDTSIELGSLIAGTPSTQQTTLTVSFGGAGQYQVTAIEETPLQTFDSSNTIPDTACDGGGDTSTISSAKLWTSNSQYGFGYNMTGDDIPADFTNSTYYRPFPDRSSADSPIVVMSSDDVGRSRESTVTFKVNVS
ncbi:MAG: hypothetical protein WEC80_00320, partial [Patescibacteria group bacterium]